MLTTTKQTPDEADDIDLRVYVRFLGTYWLVIVAAAIAGAALALFLASRVPVRYQATATLAVAQKAATPAFPLTPATSRALLTNTTLLTETLNELGLQASGLTPASFLADALDIQPVPTTNLIRVSVTLPDPTKAREAARIMSEKAVALSRRVDQEGATGARDAIKRQLEEAAERLDALGAGLLSHKAAAQIDVLHAATDAQLRVHADLAELTMDLAAERARLARLEEDVAKLPPALDGQSGTNRATPTDPRAGDSVHSMLQYDIAQSRATISGLERRRQEIERTAGSTARQLNELYRRQLELGRLEGEYDVAMRVHSDLVAEYEDARTRVTAGTPQLQIVETPLQPERPLPRRTVQYGLLGALAGAVVGLIASALFSLRTRGRL